MPSGDSAHDTYTSSWISTHETWFTVTHERIDCGGSVHFPVCVDGQSLESDSTAPCPAYACSGPCAPTPADTIDFVAPPPPNSLDSAGVLCPLAVDHIDPLPPFYGFDTGVPPLFVDLQFSPLQLSGTVRGQLGATCSLVAGASVEIWHVDPTGFNLSTFSGVRAEGSSYETSQRLRARSCRGLATTGPDGAYSFDTSVPPPYGPPRHINVMVSAPGFQTLITRVYFSNDLRLRQLTVLRGEEDTTFIEGLSGQEYNHGFIKGTKQPDQVGSRNDDKSDQNAYAGNIVRDPRVLDVYVMPVGVPVSLAATFDIVLRPLRPADSMTSDVKDESAATAAAAAGRPSTPEPPLDLSGIWSDEVGGLITVETIGGLFLAAEYPHPRRWGTVFGALSGDTIRGVDFRGLNHADSIMSDLLQRYMQLGTDGEVRPVLSKLNSQLLWQEGDGTISRPTDALIDTEPTVGIEVAEAVRTSNNLRNAALESIGGGGRGVGGDLTNAGLWTTARSTGVVSRLDAFSTDVDEALIEWSGETNGQFMKQYWTKQTASKNYR